MKETFSGKTELETLSKGGGVVSTRTAMEVRPDGTVGLVTERCYQKDSLTICTTRFLTKEGKQLNIENRTTAKKGDCATTRCFERTSAMPEPLELSGQ